MSGYELIDSGDGAKLERFGSKVLMRPSSVAVWRRRRGAEAWKRADAVYDPSTRWEFKGKPFAEWELEIGKGLTLLLRPQKNGQIGVFPEHLSYLPQLQTACRRLVKVKGSPIRVLNLFAYTGAATVACLAEGAEVTHVDLAKKCLDWARLNIERNKLGGSGARLIPEDAITFLEREKRRGNSYDLIVADPPSFSRPSRNDSWQIDKVLVDLIEKSEAVLERACGAFFITAHRTGIRGEILKNIVLDSIQRPAAELSSEYLKLTESAGERDLPAGVLVWSFFGKL